MSGRLLTSETSVIGTLRRCTRRALLVAAVSATGAIVGALPGVAEAGQDFNVWDYSYQNPCGQTPIDPIGVTFFGTAAHFIVLAGGANDKWGDITFHVRPRWTRHSWDNTFPQRILDDGCVENPPNTDLATADGLGNDRGHVRMWTLNQPVNNNLLTRTTPHYEEWKAYCGATGSHAVTPDDDRGHSGYDYARYELANWYRRARVHRHPVYKAANGATYSTRQCTGHHTSSSGGHYYIRIGHPGGG